MREPLGYQHPLDLLDIIVAGAPRMLPVSQAINYGPQPSRSMQFAADIPEEIAARAVVDRLVGFKDRRFDGRRYRSTYKKPREKGRSSPIPWTRP